MSTTPNLLIAHIAAAQNQKEVTANDAFNKLDTAMNDNISVAITGTTHTLAQADALQNVFFIFTGALSGNNTITLPANKRIYVVVNNTTGGFNLIFKAGAGTATVTVSDTGVAHFIYSDGVNTVYEVGSPVSAGALQHPVKAETGTSYTVLNADRGKLLTFDNASSVAVTLPQAGAASAFLAGWFAFVQNKNVGVVTITPTTSTINGAATLVLQKNGYVLIVSDGTNYQVFGVTAPSNLTQEFVALLNRGPVLLGGASDKTGFAFGQSASNYGVVWWDPATGETKISFVSGGTTVDPAIIFARSGSVSLVNLPGRVGQYQGVATVKAGIPSELATADLLGQTAAIGATTLYAVPAAGAGLYRVHWAAKITTPATTSSVLGGSASLGLLYTDADDSVAASINDWPVYSGNTTGVALSGVLTVNAKASTNIQFTFDYTSVGGTPMAYSLHIRLEYLG